MSLSPSRTRWWLLAIVVFAFVVRLALVLHAGERVLVDDETGYDNIASNVVNGVGYHVGFPEGRHHPTAARGPSYVFYVAAFYWVFGREVIPPLVGHCVLDAIACFLAYWITRRLFQSRRSGLVAAALYAVYWPFIFNTTQLITETFTNVAFLGTIAAFLEYIAHRRTRFLILSGFVLGLGALIKPQLAPICVLFAIIAVPVLGWRKAIRASFVVSIVTFLCLAPWIVRNAMVFHEFIPGVTQVGYTFWGGTAPVGGYRMIGSISDPAVPDSLRQRLAKVDGELEQHHWFMREGMRVIKDDPWRYVRLNIRKISTLWLNVGFDEPPSNKSWALAAFNLVAFAFAIYALRTAHPSPLAARLLIVLWIFWTLSNMPAPALVRYAFPYYALLFCYTGAGIHALMRRRFGWAEESALAAS